jgi:LuxR family maltose regulon positive regulatory protein
MISSVEPGTHDAAVELVAVPGAAGVVARPELLRRLDGPARVTVVSAPPGSGKTVLLRSWIAEAGLADRAGWVPAGAGDHDPRRFWLSVLDALRGTVPGAGLVRPVTAAPDLDGWAIAERLLTDLAPLDDQVWLVVDDVHELDPDALRQLELLVLRAPRELRFVLASRRDVQLGLHRLRLEGGLAEIRERDLRFSLAEARELFTGAGVVLAGPALEVLHERTEGWVAGLRLAALSLAGHPDPERFAAGFSGTERTVAEYLLAEVLDRQSERVRRLLLRTSVLDRVNGELAGLLTGDGGGERVLQDLEKANAFVASLDPARSWFRYHQMFAGLLQMELRRVAPGEVTGLHRAAAAWFAARGFAVEAIRHAQAARDWEVAARLLADHWPGLYLDGHDTAVQELLAGFPAGVRAADAGLAAVTAGDELARGSLAEAERHLGMAARGAESVPAARRGQFRLLLGVVRLLHARQRGNPQAVREEAERLEAVAEAPDPAQTGLHGELRALALISLGITEFWAARMDHAGRHLEQGVALAQRIGRPYLEFSGLAYQAAAVIFQSFERAEEFCARAVELARRHGWTDEPPAGIAYFILGSKLALQGRPDEAEPWIQRAERTIRAEAEPAAGVGVRYIRGFLELTRGHEAEALAAFQAAERLAGYLAASHALVTMMRAFQLQTLLRLGETGGAGQILASFDDRDRDTIELCIATALLRFARGDLHAAIAELAPVRDGSARPMWPVRPIQAFLLEAIARDALGDSAAAARALERALDIAEPDDQVLWFLLHPVPGLLERHARDGGSHAALAAGILRLMDTRDRVSSPAGPPPLLESLSDSEVRVLRYLPTNLTAREIAGELSVTRHTIKAHMRNLYAKLGTHRRAETVARARDLGLLAPSAVSSSGSR